MPSSLFASFDFLMMVLFRGLQLEGVGGTKGRELVFFLLRGVVLDHGFFFFFSPCRRTKFGNRIEEAEEALE